MTKAVFLPSSGDPFLLYKWLSCLDVWKDEVDQLYLLVNANLSKETRSYIRTLIAPFSEKVIYMEREHLIDHGPALKIMLDGCTEDLILLVEEDGMIFKKGIVEKCFKEIEDGEVDLIGSPRGSCPEELWSVENKLWPETPEQQPNFWPNFLFVKREDLLKTDKHFAATSWEKGDFIPQLDHIIEAEVVPSDTFVWASIQLRGLGLRVKLLPQYHAMAEDLEHKDKIEGIFDRKAPWVHFGSSSTWSGILMGPDIPQIHGTPIEWEPRAALWLMCWDDAQETLPKYMQDFSTNYKAGIERLIQSYTLSASRVKYRAELYRTLLKGVI
jgi:hypothetical protein